jgi:iodotyrosine deiodinase
MQTEGRKMLAHGATEYTPIELPHRHNLDDREMAEAAATFLDKMRQRHSVRDFSDRPVPRQIMEKCIAAAGTAPSGANHQPWHFVAISDTGLKSRIRTAAEAEEERFYSGAGGEEWLRALEPIGTDAAKPHLEIAPWLIVVFAQRYTQLEDGRRFKNYYVPESVGIATGFLIAALHHAGLSALTHTPNPMRFLTGLLGRPESEKPVMILAVGHPSENATVPAAAKVKKPLNEILTVFES